MALGTERKTGRPESKNKSRAVDQDTRPARTPIGDYRDKLTVHGLSEDYVPRWVVDSAESGQRILMFKAAGYEFVTKDEVNVGEASVHQSEGIGSIVRTSAGQGSWNYLMKIKKEFYSEDQIKKMDEVSAQENSNRRENTGRTIGEDGMYGSVSIG